jgi:23S rRNA pseudouridine1911/1915/1917 synthase
MSNEFPYKIEVLYEDDGCVVINKPAGLIVHPDGRNTEAALTDWVVEKYPEAVNVGEPSKTPTGETIIRPGIVHRLDRETSGAVVIAKTAEAHAFLKKQFQDRLVSKKYLAFVWGEFTEEFGTITRPIGRSANDFPKWSAQRGARGDMRDAETYWTRLWTGQAEVKSDKEGAKERQETGLQKFSLVLAEPKTGRTHQIRVHFLAIHHPVVSDGLYAERKPQALGFKRTALHARSIEFMALNGKKVKVIAPLPEDFERACKSMNVDIKKV